MRLDVAFLPRDLERVETSVCIVIDALRASSTIATLLGRGVREIVVAGTIEDARRVHAGLPEALLCGESGGLPPAGFDHGNSPAEFERLEVAGRTVVLATSNGTRALAALGEARAVFVGSLLNLTACARAALDAAGDGEITVVCAGNEHGRRFSLEDTFVAGAFVERLVNELADRSPEGPADLGGAVQLTDAATAAYRIWRSYPGGPRTAFGEGTHGQGLAAIGLSEDLDACARIDVYAVAPRLRAEADGRFILTAS